MSSSATILDVIKHYQCSINISQDNAARLLHCISKLHHLPIKIEHLQKTGVCKTVKTLRKFNGEVGSASKSLVKKWKAMVAAGEESFETTSTPSKTDAYAETTEGSDGRNGSSDETNDENYNRHENKYTDERRKEENHKKKNSINKDCSPYRSNSSFTYQQSNEIRETIRKQNRKEETNKNKRESSYKHSSTIKEKEKVDKHQESSGSGKCHHQTDEFKSPPLKKAKTSSTESNNRNKLEERENYAFDSSMGVSFGDILEMLNVPRKKSKKSSKSSPASKTPDAAKIAVPKIVAGHYNPNNNASKESPVVGNVSKTSHLSYSLAPLPSSSKTLTEKPHLLAPTPKLETLDPSIALELPTTSTNYMPMPLNPTVMDCVFNTNKSTSTTPARTMSDAEALSHCMTSKTVRTKVYSGVRTGHIYQASSLKDLCISFLQKNIDSMEYTGGVPYYIMEPVLKKATPHQLFTFENYNPYLMEETDDLWQMHVSQNYRTQKRLENETWREMYFRCQEEEGRKLNLSAGTIIQSQEVAAAPVCQVQLPFLDTMVEPSLNVQRQQEQYGTKAKTGATPAGRVAYLSATTTNTAKLEDVRLKVLAGIRDNAQVTRAPRKKAPLMKKTLKFIRGRFKR